MRDICGHAGVVGGADAVERAEGVGGIESGAEKERKKMMLRREYAEERREKSKEKTQKREQRAERKEPALRSATTRSKAGIGGF